MIEASYYSKRDSSIRCQLCPQVCLIHPNEVGLCFVRLNKNGKLFALNYERASSLALDPIEKKPLYHFFPGSTIYSVGSIGCNLGCPFCQNFSIAQPKDFFLEDDPQKIIQKASFLLRVDDLVRKASELKSLKNIGIAYTYNEPFMFFEYVRDAVSKAREAGLKNVLVTNGFINTNPLKEVLPFIDAMNIDLKGIENEVYQQLGGRLGPVKKTILLAKEQCHIELTNLLVPGLNDSESQVKALVDWVATEVGKETPLHFSCYFPAFKFKEPKTSLETLKLAEKIGKEKLKYVHLGNV